MGVVSYLALDMLKRGSHRIYAVSCDNRIRSLRVLCRVTHDYTGICKEANMFVDRGWTGGGLDMLESRDNILCGVS